MKLFKIKTGILLSVSLLLLHSCNKKSVKPFSENKFLQNVQGTWVCYKYTPDPTEKEKADEDFAREFSKHAWFDITNEKVIGVNLYETPSYAYNYPVDFVKVRDESYFISFFNPQSDSVIFMRPHNPYEFYYEQSDSLPYYAEAPLNSIKMFYNDEFILRDEGYFYFFRKGEPSDKNTKGVPGDNRNSFRVEKTFSNGGLELAYRDFISNFPYGAKQVFDETSLPRLLANDWEINQNIKFEKTQANGKFVVNFSFNNEDIIITYYSADDEEETPVSDKTEKRRLMVKHFYESYMKDMAENARDNEVREILMEMFLTPQFRVKLAEMEEIDCDPLLNAQDFDSNWISSLKVEQFPRMPETFLVSYNAGGKIVRLIVSVNDDEDDDHYQINDVQFD
ncbi:MAG: DUF3828 domain-containing protein [Dysgonomonas sp.]|nr:DUF3828 domain-containing protein [Dysgonomonas sp.]